jgi:sulfhydrogenase subunit alpha
MSEVKTLDVPILTRVEGEGALRLVVKKNEIESLLLRIYEPPRLFEKFLEGRKYSEIADIVARICGICPVAYQMSALHALESIFNVDPGPWVREIRRLFYCGEWLQSHSLHVHLLALPDFFQFESAIEMAKKYPEVIKRGMRLQRLGNSIIRLLGGRAVHPVGACVGGFYHTPSLEEVQSTLAQCKEGLQDIVDTVHFLAQLSIPKYHQDITCVALHHGQEYPFNEGRLVSNKGLDISIDEFEEHFKEFQVQHSTALHCFFEDKPYLVGPLARLNLNYQLLPEEVLQLVDEIRLHLPSNNMFDSIFARAIEMHFAILEAVRILKNYQVPKSCRVREFTVQPGIGFGCTEAPRGICWHRYDIDEKGFVKSGRIIPPTSQNQAQIEEDLKASLKKFGLDKNNDQLRLFAEMVIRNYDPCISCSVHFLNLKIARL